MNLLLPPLPKTRVRIFLTHVIVTLKNVDTYTQNRVFGLFIVTVFAMFRTPFGFICTVESRKNDVSGETFALIICPLATAWTFPPKQAIRTKLTSKSKKTLDLRSSTTVKDTPFRTGTSSHQLKPAGNLYRKLDSGLTKSNILPTVLNIPLTVTLLSPTRTFQNRITPLDTIPLVEHKTQTHLPTFSRKTLVFAYTIRALYLLLPTLFLDPHVTAHHIALVQKSSTHPYHPRINPRTPHLHKFY